MSNAMLGDSIGRDNLDDTCTYLEAMNATMTSHRKTS